MTVTTRTPAAATAALGALVLASLAGCAPAGPGPSAPAGTAGAAPEHRGSETTATAAAAPRYAVPGQLAGPPGNPDAPAAPTDTADRDSGGEDGAGEDGVGQDATGQDATGQDVPGHDATGQDAAGQAAADAASSAHKPARAAGGTAPDPGATAPQPGAGRPASGPSEAAQPAADRSARARLGQLDLDRVRAGVQLVPRTPLGDLPPRLAALDRADARKRLFLKAMLPAVLKANAAIARQRDFVEAVETLEIPPGELPTEMRERLDRLAARYGVAPGNIAGLKRRVDRVPAALVLAQAAIETGWGTSRFAQQGNAIFGQHTSDPDVPGMVPQGLEDPGFRVRAFETITQAVEAYLLNLNSHPAYAELRAIRADQRARGERPEAVAMAAGLVDYSARGQAYVEDIRLTIRANDLQQFAEARLRPSPERLVDARPFGRE
jgi:Bax protein